MTCLCGCGGSTTSFYVPGHDQRHVSAVVREMRGTDRAHHEPLLGCLASDALRARARASFERPTRVRRSTTDPLILGSAELPSLHPSDSSVQLRAEAAILARLSARLGVALNPIRLKLPSGAAVNVDGYSPTPPVLVEVFAHQGRMRGGQQHKVSTDVLKLTTIRSLLLPDASLVLALADDRAAQSLTGWRREACGALGVAIMVVDISEDLRAEIIAAQVLQRMVNPSSDE